MTDALEIANRVYMTVKANSKSDSVFITHSQDGGKSDRANKDRRSD
jgi:hypothetical protein